MKKKLKGILAMLAFFVGGTAFLVFLLVQYFYCYYRGDVPTF